MDNQTPNTEAATLLAVFSKRRQAGKAAQHLKKHGFAAPAIKIVGKNYKASTEWGLTNAELARKGAWIGAICGGMLGFLIGWGILMNVRLFASGFGGVMGLLLLAVVGGIALGSAAGAIIPITTPLLKFSQYEDVSSGQPTLLMLKLGSSQQLVAARVVIDQYAPTSTRYYDRRNPDSGYLF